MRLKIGSGTGLVLGVAAAALALSIGPDRPGSSDAATDAGGRGGPGARARSLAERGAPEPGATRSPAAIRPTPARAGALADAAILGSAAVERGGDAARQPDASAEDAARRALAASLDRAPVEFVRATLEEAATRARTDRPLLIAPGVIEQAAQAGEVQVVFATARGTDDAHLARVLDSGGRSDSVVGLRSFPLLGHAAATLSAGALFNLIDATQTRSIELDAVHRPTLLESVPQVGADTAHANGYDGDGIAVVVIDTGIDADHPMFGTRVVEEACFSGAGDCPNAGVQMLGAGAAAPCALPGCDHGTHVAGIAAGDADTGPLVGLAPRAELIAINVFSDIDGEAGAYTSDLIAAMQHVLALDAFYDIAAVNLSLGGGLFTSNQACAQDSPSQLSAVGQLRSAGIATIAAAGNDGTTNALASPGCLANVISVGSVGDADGVSSFSNSASFLTLLAPGESIQSAAVGGGLRNASGTSMATPHVAGAFAAIREAVPTATVDQIQNALLLTGEPITDGRNGETTQRLRVDAAIAMLLGNPSLAGDPDPQASAAGGGGGGCGLVGIEPFLVLGLVRLGRSARRRLARGR